MARQTKQVFETILVACDGSPQAQRATELAFKSARSSRQWSGTPIRSVRALDSSRSYLSPRPMIEPPQWTCRSTLAVAPSEVLSCSILVQDTRPFPKRSRAAFQEAMEDGRC
jgi:hypothetical protein